MKNNIINAKYLKELITVNKKVWHETDDFWEKFRPIMFGQDAYKNASDQIDSIISLLNIETDVKVLDLACGIGRHSLELARRGFTITGVDRTKSYLENARSRISTGVWD